MADLIERNWPCEHLPLGALRVITANHPQLAQEAAGLPSHLTSFPVPCCSLLHCFPSPLFLCAPALCSHAYLFCLESRASRQTLLLIAKPPFAPPPQKKHTHTHIHTHTV